MEISDLKVRQEKVDIEAEVTAMEEPRSFNKFGKTIRVANATVADSSGTIKLTLWNNDIDVVKVGDKVKITNGFVNEFQGEKQLTSGKFGKLEVVGKGEGKVEEKVEEKEEKTEKKKKTKEKKEEEKSEEKEVCEICGCEPCECEKTEEAETEDY